MGTTTESNGARDTDTPPVAVCRFSLLRIYIIKKLWICVSFRKKEEGLAM